MAGKRIRYAWHSGGAPESVYPISGEGEVQRETTPVIIAGMVDAEGKLLSYVPVGGSVAQVSPSKDSEVTLATDDSIAAGDSRVYGSFDMSEWEHLIVRIENVASGGGSLAAADITVKVQHNGNELSIFDAAVSGGAEAVNASAVGVDSSFIIIFRNVGGNSQLQLKVINGNAATRVLSTYVTRFSRIHG